MLGIQRLSTSWTSWHDLRAVYNMRHKVLPMLQFTKYWSADVLTDKRQEKVYFTRPIIQSIETYSYSREYFHPIYYWINIYQHLTQISLYASLKRTRKT